MIATLLALIMDTVEGLFTLAEYSKCGHLHFDLLLTLTGVSLTVLAVYLWSQWWRSRRPPSVASSARLPPSPR